MGKIAITFGALMITLGVGAYISTGSTSITALIPAAFGFVLVVAGLVGDKFPASRMHAMHTAVLVALIGLIVSAAKAIPALINHDQRPRVYIQSVFALLCAVFVALCVRSFIEARRQRKQQAGGSH